MTRRTFVRHATYLTALASRTAAAAPALNPNSLAKFVDPLPIPEIAKPSVSARAGTFGEGPLFPDSRCGKLSANCIAIFRPRACGATALFARSDV